MIPIGKMDPGLRAFDRREDIVRSIPPRIAAPPR